MTHGGKGVQTLKKLVRDWIRLMVLGMAVTTIPVGLMSCDDGNDDVEDAADDAGDAVEDAADEAGDAVDNAADEVEDATDDAGD